MSNVILHGKSFKIKITASEINKAVADVARQINTNLKDKKPLFLAVLNGSFMFASDLMKKIKIDCEISFIKVASYEGTSSTGSMKELIGINESIKGRNVVIIEDIVDTGTTVENVYKQLQQMGAAEISVATLLFKPDAIKHPIPIDYCCFNIPNKFVLGYGLDYDGFGRNLREIYQLHS